MPAAKADLVNIRAYIRETSPAAAAIIGRRIAAACRALSVYPARGRLGFVSGTREMTTVPPYVIVYREMPTVVEILRIWHGAQERP